MGMAGSLGGKGGDVEENVARVALLMLLCWYGVEPMVAMAGLRERILRVPSMSLGFSESSWTP